MRNLFKKTTKAQPAEPIIVPVVPAQPSTGTPITQQPINGQASGLKPKKNVKKIMIWVVASIITFFVAAGLTAFVWYNIQIAPLGTNTQKLVVVKIDSGSTPKQIGQLLQGHSVIRSGLAFDIYTRISGKRSDLQAGTYRLSPAESTSQIVDHLVKGDVDQFSITFLPGATVKQDRQVLLDAGYSAIEVDLALADTYDSPLFENKPASADLEGYIYGETYNFTAGTSVSDILKRTFTQFYSVLSADNIISGIKAQGLNLYQGITLASIVQKEIGSPTSTTPTTDQKQVAQVFYSRLATGMNLGSDVTYQYAADKLGVPRDPNLDSPYNTRRYPGLPPGPISVPGITALKAVAAPATTDYLFFLSGDDNVTYFAHTDAEHQANIKAHCAIKCSTL
ncbi:MAG: Endolytic murein transglycosylase [Candidatus Saccharibacteria bacterium]|nr:Endolytic murein transglycosylase [Candidatus Saccharibacteria bacterium]